MKVKEGSVILRSVETSCKVAINSPLAETPGSKINAASVVPKLEVKKSKL